MKKDRILILSRQQSVCEEMVSYFQETSYRISWLTEYDQAIAQMHEKTHRPDLFLFDMQVPGREEYEVLHKIQDLSDLRILILSSDDRLESQLYAYSMQIDEYMVKPVPMPLLEAHVEAILRRDEKKEKNFVRKEGALEIHYDSRCAYIDGRMMVLTPKEFDLLDFMLQHKGMILSRDKILDSVWGYDYVSGYRSVDTMVKKIRAQLTKDYPYIRTVYGIGYAFDPDIIS